MSRSADAFDKILEMVLTTKNNTRQILDAMPGSLDEPPMPPRLRVIRPAPQSPAPSSPALPPLLPPPSARATPQSSLSWGVGRVDDKFDERRLYRSLDKKHVVILQKMQLKKPMNDDEMADLENRLQAQTGCDTVDYVPSEPKLFQHLEL